MMSEYEMLSLGAVFLDALQARISLFMTGLFAMLATSHFAAAKLDRVTTAAVIGLFTLFSLLIGLSINRTVSALGALSRKTIDEYGEQVAWLYGDQAPITPTVPLMVLLIGAYGSAVWFFLYARNKERNVG